MHSHRNRSPHLQCLRQEDSPASRIPPRPPRFLRLDSRLVLRTASPHIDRTLPGSTRVAPNYRGTMREFITKMYTTGTGPRVGVKDLIDVAGVTTTAGSLAVASVNKVAVEDAPLMRGARDANARIVGK